MSQPFIGQILQFAGNFAPRGWAFCNGQLMPISENVALFTLIGTTYGGDGQSTFALPNLQGRVPIHQGTSSFGTSFVIGESSGVETVTLAQGQTPVHSHGLNAAATDPNATPTATPGPTAVFATGAPGVSPYASAAGATPQVLNPQSIGLAGGGQPHENIMPTLYCNYCISLFGIFPSQ